MPNAIEIPFEASTAGLIRQSQKVIDELERVKQATHQNSRLMEEAAKREEAARRSATMSWTDFRSMYQTVLDVVRVGQQVWEETGQKAANYAVETGNAARMAGVQIEEFSRLRQVADDVGISYQSLATSLKMARKDGIETNVESLARLSDEFLKLQPGAERTQFLMDKFGKSGEEMEKIMVKGGAAIREMSAAIDDNLIVTELGYKQAEQYRVATDELQDAWDGFTIQLGQKAIPVLTDILTASKENIKAGYDWKDALDAIPIVNLVHRIHDLKDAHKDNVDALNEATEAGKNANGVYETEEERLKRVAEEAKAAEQAIKDMTKANQDELKTLGDLTKTLTDYHGKESDLVAKHDELLSKKKDLIAQGWSAESDKIKDVNKDLAENERAQQENADAFQLATNQRILARAEELLSADGLTTEEKNGLIERGIAMGVYTQEAAARMREEESAALSLASSLNSIPKNVSTTVTTNYVMTGTPQTAAQNPNYTYSPNPAKRGRAAGGPVSAGVPYMVGERGPEPFIPNQNGSIVPNNKISEMFPSAKEIGREVGKYVGAELRKGGG